MNFFFVLELIFMITGLFFIAMAIWELRLGQSRERFLTFSFTGLVLTIVLPRLIGYSTYMWS